MYKKRHSSNVGPRSLNINVRKRENERIERENHAFAKRLFQNTGMIRKTDLDNFSQEVSMHANRIRRVKKILPGLKLKPITQDLNFKSTKRSDFSLPKK